MDVSGLDIKILKREAIAYWNLDPRNRPVKITSINRDPMFWAEGYVTCYKFVGGRSLPEVEQILGLKVGELSSGAFFHEFIDYPTADQFELKGYSQCPGGENWTPDSEYPRGLGAAQWQVKKNSFVASRVAAIVNPKGKLP